MELRSVPAVMCLLVFAIHGSLGVDLFTVLLPDWGYLDFNLTGPSDPGKHECLQNFTLLRKDDGYVNKMEEFLKESKLKVVGEKDPKGIAVFGQSCWDEDNERISNAPASGCTHKSGRREYKLTILRVATTASEKNRCLVYDFISMEARFATCLEGVWFNGIACQLVPESQPDGKDPQSSGKISKIAIIGSSIGLASLALQVIVLFACGLYWCRKKSRENSQQRLSQKSTSDMARNVRLQSLRSDYSSGYDHMWRDPMAQSIHNVAGSSQEQIHLYNEVMGQRPEQSGPYAEPYTHFIPPGNNTNQRRKLPPTVAPPCVPEVNEYAEPSLPASPVRSVFGEGSEEGGFPVSDSGAGSGRKREPQDNSHPPYQVGRGPNGRISGEVTIIENDSYIM